MPPARQPSLQARSPRLRALRTGAAVGLVLALLSAPAHAQDGSAPGVEPAEPQTEETLAPRPGEGTPLPAPAPVPEFNAAGERQVAFEADGVAYDSGGDTVTAEGNVLLRSGDQSVRADQVSWNRNSGAIVAIGNVRLHAARRSARAGR